jgi:DNA-binding transcriptional LysR family regulator
LPVPGLKGRESTRDKWLVLVPRGDFAGQEELPAHQMVKQVSTIHAMVAEGLGVSVVPAFEVQNAPKGVRTLHRHRHRDDLKAASAEKRRSRR